MTEQPPIIYWYRQDLRTHDLPGLLQAAQSGRPVLPVFILDDDTPGHWRLGSASRWWLHHSLAALAKELDDLGGKLILKRGNAQEVLQDLLAETGADSIYCSRSYTPWAEQQEEALHAALSSSGTVFKRFAGALLFEPGSVLTQTGQPYKVFTPFWRACRNLPAPPSPRALSSEICWHSYAEEALQLDALSLLPQKPDWAASWNDLWTPGSAGAEKALDSFLADQVIHYSEGRDHPAMKATSHLSPHLTFGEISPRVIWQRSLHCSEAFPERRAHVDKFLSEVGWREFSYQLLVHFPHIPEKPFKEQFEAFPWLGSQQTLSQWQRGNTGYPIVDAGMRELWATGYMHNRVRMVVASFLSKHLLTHWREGENWFWDTLVDADLANNACSWQWVAGSGADSSPYFRIFNPVAQGEKFDKGGAYTRHWVPELREMPNKYLHKPWEAPAEVLHDANVSLGETYPEPIVDHRAAREAALAAYGSIRNNEQ
ncbi:MAG: deoxyribodipyrimidine photo-lyase [Halioglobus sp.]